MALVNIFDVFIITLFRIIIISLLRTALNYIKVLTHMAGRKYLVAAVAPVRDLLNDDLVQ